MRKNFHPAMGTSLKSFVSKAYQILKLKNVPSPPPTHVTPSISTLDPYLTSEIKSITDMMHSLNAESTNLHRLYSSKLARNAITFIEVAHNPVMTVVIIVIPNGQRLPLHDHPDMLGFIKVLHGQVRISTYTKIGFSEEGRQPAIRTQNTVLSRLSYPQVLTPVTNNVHEITFESGEGGKDYAAFIDVLSPSYDDAVGCHYYACGEQDLSQKNGDEGVHKCTLIETECPADYRTVCLPYPYL